MEGGRERNPDRIRARPAYLAHRDGNYLRSRLTRRNRRAGQEFAAGKVENYTIPSIYAIPSLFPSVIAIP